MEQRVVTAHALSAVLLLDGLVHVDTAPRACVAAVKSREGRSRFLPLLIPAVGIRNTGQTAGRHLKSRSKAQNGVQFSGGKRPTLLLCIKKQIRRIEYIGMDISLSPPPSHHLKHGYSSHCEDPSLNDERLYYQHFHATTRQIQKRFISRCITGRGERKRPHSPHGVDHVGHHHRRPRHRPQYPPPDGHHPKNDRSSGATIAGNLFQLLITSDRSLFTKSRQNDTNINKKYSNSTP